MPKIGMLNFPDTTSTHSIKTTSTQSIHGSETAYSTDSSFTSIVPNENFYFTSARAVASSINETTHLSSTKSLFYDIVLQTANANVSPVIDLKRVNAFAISNRLNQPAVSNTDTFTGDGSTTAFTMAASPSSVHLLSVKKSGKKLSPVDDFTVSGSTLTLTTAPASGSKIVAKLSNMVNYEDDTATEGGSSEGSYLTRPVTLENPSTDT